MTCRDAEDFIVSYASGRPVPPEAAAHFARCEQCRRLARAMETREAASLQPSQLQQIEGRLLAGLKPVRRLPAAPVLFGLFAVVLIIVVAIGGTLLGPSGWQAESQGQRLAVFIALAVAAGCLTVSLERQMVPGSTLTVSPSVLIGLVVAAMVTIVAIFFRPRPEAAFVSDGLVCIRIGFEYGVLAGALLWLVLARGAILKPVLAGGTAGALGGLSGLTVLEVICPNLNAYHVMVWHIGALVASIALGAAIGVAAEYLGRREI